MAELNSINCNIEFVKEEEGLSVPFLQTKLSIIGNEIVARWFRKPQAEEDFHHYFSNVPMHVKKATIVNAIKTLKVINNTIDGLKDDLSILKNILESNAYPEKFITRMFELDTKV